MTAPCRPASGSPAPRIDILRDHPRYVERLRERGNALYVFTVDDPADVELCLRLGADAIITNRPADVLPQLGR